MTTFSTSEGSTLPDSRLYTLIDQDRRYALYFLEGQQLIHDLALVHPVKGFAFAYFRDTLLSVQPMIALIKGGEQFGFYIDSERPDFRLKIETGHQGATRCMLLPENFAEFPEELYGMVRLLKVFPNEPQPYESVLEIDGLPLREIVNRVLTESYQVNCAIAVSKTSDQSLMLHQLPPIQGREDYEYSPEAVRERREGIREAVEAIFDRAMVDRDELIEAFSAIGFRLLADRRVRFECNCSRERMLSNLWPIYAQEGDSLFEPGETHLTVRCEYCKSEYRIAKAELEGGHGAPH